ncbi:MAG: D-alanyl-D-alanine carboxypeptidase/D-alanyl-D-alanine endopeptidase [Legionella sp.]
MKWILYSIFFWTFSCAAWPNSTQTAVDKLINQVDPATNIGIEVVDLDTGINLYQRNPNKLFIPASNMKLFSNAAALIALGPDYRFQTTLSTDAHELRNGYLKGSIYLYLPGDPSLTRHDIQALMAQLKNWGIRYIEGNIVIVSNHSGLSPYAPGWLTKDLQYSYGAPLAPLMIDENRLMVTINPNDVAGKPAIIELETDNASISVNNQVNTTGKARGCGIDLHMDANNSLTIRGCVKVGQWAIQQRIAIHNPLRYAQALIKNQLIGLNITLKGQVVLGNAQSRSLLLANHASKPISQLLANTLKPSDNLYADSLFLHTAATISGKPLNWAQAQLVIKEFLQKQTNVNLSNAVLTDGSGLSRQDLVTPQQTVELLRFLHDRFPLAYEYIAALPVAGRDGTLQRRLRLPSQQDLVRAKTGTMSGIIGLSGYLYTANAHTLAFTIFINKQPRTNPNASGQYRYLVDAICNYFLHYKPDGNRFLGSLSPHQRLAFQMKPTQADQQRNYTAKWRQIESSIKLALKGKAVSLLFHSDELILNDNLADQNVVWSILKSLSKKYKIAVALVSNQLQIKHQRDPNILWIKAPDRRNQTLNKWIIRPAVT